jgi:hypothetical protein
MGRVAVDFGVGQGAKRSADIRSDLGQASNAGQRQNQRNPGGHARPIPVFEKSLRAYLRTKLLQPTIHAQRYTAVRQTNGLSIVKPTAIFETKGP